MTLDAQPILYTFRRCPYAIRARLALAQAGLTVESREVLLRDKPPAMLALAREVGVEPTVPLLQLPSGEVLAESFEIVTWALQQYDPENWLQVDPGELAALESELAQPETNDAADLPQGRLTFKAALDRYKYADRHPQATADQWRACAEPFLAELESRLARDGFLLAGRSTVADVLVMPFVRQFAAVDRPWFADSPYRATRTWLQAWLDAPLFRSVMQKQRPWSAASAV